MLMMIVMHMMMELNTEVAPQLSRTMNKQCLSQIIYSITLY